ncbi:hypothetical protein RR47_GL001785 [Enterococcus columbae DSM 7374 = ATCC 51263]|nr:hypothetical protein RR47_GL001785 [Enterococcus columbae DSM 7374 = ATCC 51263]
MSVFDRQIGLVRSNLADFDRFLSLAVNRSTEASVILIGF